MNTTQRTVLTTITFICLLFAACAPQTPIPVYVTPTGQIVPTSEPTPLPPMPTESNSDYRLTRLQTTAVPTTALTPRRIVTVMGPVIGPGYNPPPTNTPLPTTPPTAMPTGAVTTESLSSATAAPIVPEAAATDDLTPVLSVPDLDPNRMGIQIDTNLEQADWDNAMHRMGAQLGLKWIKLQIPWEDMQPNGPDEVSVFFRRVQMYVEDADRRQLNILLSVVKAPAWARSNLSEDGPPDDPQAFANFLSLLLREFGGAIDAVEVWNEPNLIREWQGSLSFNGAGYMQLFTPAYQAIRAYSPTITIITAGLAPTSTTGGSIDDRAYLRQMYAAGLGGYRDIVIGTHPYGWANAPDATCCGTIGWDNDPHFFFGDNIRAYREIMVEGGHSDLDMWITEFGWATWDGYPSALPPGEDWIGWNDRWDQAHYTIRAFQIGQQSEFIGNMFLWNLNFATLAGLIENSDERAAYSIVVPGSACVVDTTSADRTERPLYWMLYDAIRPEENLTGYDC